MGGSALRTCTSVETGSVKKTVYRIVAYTLMKGERFTAMAIPKELIDEILKGYKKPEDLVGDEGILKYLTRWTFCHQNNLIPETL